MIPGSEPHTGGATPDALHRWARRDAEPFLAAHPLPDEPLPLPDLNPYLTVLAEAETPAEVSAVTQQLFGATAPLLDHIAGHFVALALWAGHGHRHTPEAANLLRDAGRSIRSALMQVAWADWENLRAHYAPPAVGPGEEQADRTAASRPSPPGPSAPSGPPRSRR